jgi:hypothetical protein
MPTAPKSWFALGAVGAFSVAAASSLLSTAALVPLTACDTTDLDASASDGDLASDGAVIREAIDYTTLCTRLINQCGQPIVQADCIKSYASLRVTPTCTNAIAQATCDDITNASSAVMQTCFPPCNGTLAQCNGDGTITQCSQDGETQVLDCAGYCVAQGFTKWTGTCDTTYQGQTSALPQCWCQ